MNASINFSTFLQADNKNNQKARRENGLFREINDIETVNADKNPMTNINKSQSAVKT